MIKGAFQKRIYSAKRLLMKSGVNLPHELWSVQLHRNIREIIMAWIDDWLFSYIRYRNSFPWTTLNNLNVSLNIAYRFGFTRAQAATKS